MGSSASSNLLKKLIGSLDLAFQLEFQLFKSCQSTLQLRYLHHKTLVQVLILRVVSFYLPEQYLLTLGSQSVCILSVYQLFAQAKWVSHVACKETPLFSVDCLHAIFAQVTQCLSQLQSLPESTHSNLSPFISYSAWFQLLFVIKTTLWAGSNLFTSDFRSALDLLNSAISKPTVYLSLDATCPGSLSAINPDPFSFAWFDLIWTRWFFTQFFGFATFQDFEFSTSQSSFSSIPLFPNCQSS